MRTERILMMSRGMLTSQQLQGLQHAEQNASRQSAAAEPSLLTRVAKLGFTRSDLIKALAFIRDRAPIVVHVCLAGSDHEGHHPILTDTHYRCGPELGGADSQRFSAEEHMFGPSYGDGMKGADRVKYGALNLTVDPTGVSTAHSYGDSFLLLRNETIRARITITSTDSYEPEYAVGTCESMKHVLDNSAVSDQELTNLLKIAIGETRHAGSRGQGWCYKEVQIHGPLDLRRDVSCLFVNRRHKDDEEMMKQVEAFRIRNKCEVVIMEKVDGAEDRGEEEKVEEE